MFILIKTSDSVEYVNWFLLSEIAGHLVTWNQLPLIIRLCIVTNESAVLLH
jgi:hypothetical protein